MNEFHHDAEHSRNENIPRPMEILPYRPIVGKEVVLSFPSLEKRALVKIASVIWNRADVRTMVENIHFHSEQWERIKQMWNEIEDQVTEKVKELLLPKPMMKKMLNIVKPIGMELFKWKYFHVARCGLDIRLPDEFCWTAHGCIDKLKTAQKMIKNGNFDQVMRYKIALFYCMEDDVMEMQNVMSDQVQRSIYSRIRSLSVLHDLMFGVEVSATDEEARLDSRILHVFQVMYFGHQTALKFVLQKLTAAQRISLRGFVYYTLDNVISNSLHHSEEYIAELALFLLSQTDEENQTAVVKEHGRFWLCHFLDWPWQELFMQIANLSWSVLPNSVYEKAFRKIIDKVLEGYEDYDYRYLLTELWQKSNISHKRHIISSCVQNNLLLDLFVIQFKENICLILEFANVNELEKITSEYEKKCIDTYLPCNLLFDYKYSRYIQHTIDINRVHKEQVLFLVEHVLKVIEKRYINQEDNNAL